ncbi:GNAT family N-acetyltransferase [Streptomyces sp. NPDC047315]|uniref:GNAT family N-acetyltransferase n=1 Tax=Streptomyces sp. NPDC047315 TaxID=3155142 RepID=UPI0033ECD01E
MNVKIYRDALGVPHLRADTAEELAYAQGWNAAVDRGWQIEVERHRSQGTSASFLGPDAVAWDVFARRSRLDDTARRCFDRLDDATATWVTRYVAGVNAGIAEGARRAPQFAATGLAPRPWEPWAPLGIWLSTHVLFAGFPTKLWREEVARALGEGAIELFSVEGAHSSGSNGWLVGADRTAHGAPLIAGDPHRPIEDPGVYQQVRLACDAFDVVGLAVPGVPGIAHFGHAGSVAWAITNSMADYQDLYRERLRKAPDGSGSWQALGPRDWRPVSVRTETVEVAGAPAVSVEVAETERGPVVVGELGDSDSAGTGDVLSLRTPPRVTAELGFAALPALLRARTVADVDRALDGWVEPVNVVLAADTEGGLLHRVAGRVPSRHRDNLLRPVPGWEPAHVWHGWRANPRTAVGAFAVMANERGLAAPLGVEFAPPHRARRIRELLHGRRTWTAEGMAEVHRDTRLDSAAPLLALLEQVAGLSSGAEQLRARLLAWDRRMDAESADAACYADVRAAVVQLIAARPELKALAENVESRACPEAMRPWLAFLPRVAFALEGLLTSPGASVLAPPDRIEVVRTAVEQVAADHRARRADVSEPTWGARHRLAPWSARPEADAPEWPGVPGDHDCVLSASSVPGVTDLSTRGPAARFVWDLARRDNSRWIVPLGASGVIGDPHRRDQLPLWLRGELAPVVTDWNRLTEEHFSAMSAASPTPLRRAVHEQSIDGFGLVRVLPLDPTADLDLVHGWVTAERARFWGMQDHTREQVRETYAYVDSLTTHHAFVVERDGRPVALFQTYEPAADPVGECYDVRPGDIGVHLLIAPASDQVPGGERGFTEALLQALVGYVFGDPAHLRVVVEPDARNDKAIERMLKAGFEAGPEIQKPEKVARLAFLSRERWAARG